jgi:hypothetical protein
MTVTDLIPTIRGLSNTDKLLLLQVLVQELLKSEGVVENSPAQSSAPATQQPDTEASTLTLDDRRAFLKLPLEERRRRLAEQAETMQQHYETLLLTEPDLCC